MQRAVLLTLLALAVTFGLGPDLGGYRAVDSDTVAGPSFAWVDISASGTRVVLGDDDNQGPFPLRFSFPFYRASRDSVRICSNGWLSFTSASHQFHHYRFPDVRDPNALIAPLWADLDPSIAGAVYYLADTGHGRFIVSWLGVPFHGQSPGDTNSFQVIFDTSGTILFQYLRVSTTGWFGIDSCSTGIENDSGTAGLEYLRDGTPPGNSLRDSLAIRFYRLEHDVCPTAILRPGERVLAGDTVTPLVVVWNPGLQSASFPVVLKIGETYEQQVDVVGLPALADTVLAFPGWVAGDLNSDVEAVAVLPGDEAPDNDTITSQTTGSWVGEIAYDDGESDTFFLRNGSPANDWAALVRFTPPYDEYRLTGVRIFVQDTLPFARILVCPDSSGAPKLGFPLLRADSVAADEPGTWLELGADTVVAFPGDLWLVAFWPRSARGPAIGEDRDLPLDGRSWCGSPTVRWLPYAGGDLLMRLAIDGRAGIVEGPSREGPCFTLDVRPCPFRASVTITLRSAPRALGHTSTSVRILDVSGRLVRQLPAPQFPAAGPQILTWNGCDERGVPLPDGTYFVQLQDGVEDCLARVVLAR